MTRDSIQTIRAELRDTLAELDELDSKEDWSDQDRNQLRACLLDVAGYVSRQEEYYQQYRGLKPILD
jgi:hypothetical protein